MAEVLAVVLLGDLDLGAGDDGAGKRGAQEVPILVDGVALDGSVDDLLDKNLLQVLDHYLLGAEGQSLLLDGSKVLLLATSSQEGDDLIALVDEPFEDGRGIETCRRLELAVVLEGHLFLLWGTRGKVGPGTAPILTNLRSRRYTSKYVNGPVFQ